MSKKYTCMENQGYDSEQFFCVSRDKLMNVLVENVPLTLKFKII